LGAIVGTGTVLEVNDADTTVEETPPLKERAYSFSLADTDTAAVYFVQVELSVEIWMESDPLAVTATDVDP
jgi:hypothetical protein